MKIIVSFFLLFFVKGFSQDKNTTKDILRVGFIYGFSSQNTYIKQDSDYKYNNEIFKLSTHINLLKKNKHSWEFLMEPSYYKSEHEAINYWHKFFTDSQNPNELRNEFMRLKPINEYALNLGILYRYFLKPNFSLYALGNVGPMYIDTETERLKKGFAFSDIFAVGSNYKINKISIDFKCFIRHVSNANLIYPNFGINAVGFEFGTYYEFK